MSNTPATKPEHMLPIMAVLGIMFIGICIAMNLFSRARFKKRASAFAASGRAQSRRRSNRGLASAPGNGQRLSYCSSPLVGASGQQQQQQQQPQPPAPKCGQRPKGNSMVVSEQGGRTSVVAMG